VSEFDDLNKAIIAEFRANAGKVGGRFEGAPMLLLSTTGAKSGEPRTTPVVYLQDGERMVIFASKAGADSNPAWFHNLVAHPDASVEVGTATVAVRASVTSGAERDELYARQEAVIPQFTEYARMTDREIPVLALTPRG
jgi:deazaflavin-dependent oxidoreductase (nitroreductase family)